MSPFTSTTEGAEIVEAFAKQVEGKTIVITGPSANGLGAQTAIELAAANPKELIFAGRTMATLEPVIESVRKIGRNISITFVQLDLASFASVRKAAETISSSVDKIDMLINNAGVMAVKEYHKSADGHELQFASNHLGHFLFTNLLAKKLFAAEKGATVDGKTYNLWLAYGQSKTANILFIKELARKFESQGVSAYAVHPGFVAEANLSKDIDQDTFAEGFRIANERKSEGEEIDMETKTLKSGCSTILVAALDPSLKDSSGSMLRNCSVYESVKDYATDKDNAARLWSLSETLVGQTFAY
ncbi:hypothetical protein MMC22_007696 [Lobaria immixta]|nr:hypothetical protein [Lobaria immixta]